MAGEIIPTNDVDLMNAYVAELTASNRNLTDDLMIIKAQFSLSKARNAILLGKVEELTKKVEELTPKTVEKMSTISEL